MEILTLVLSGLLSLTSGTGIIADRVAGSQISSQIISVEQQRVRIDNSPSYQVARGKLEKVRIAARGARIKPDLRIEAFELETDRLDLDLAELDLGSVDELRAALNQPLQSALRLILTEEDLNRILQSPEILAQIQQILNRLIANKAGSTNIAYRLLDLSLELHSNNRLGVNLKLVRPKSSFELSSKSNSNNQTQNSRELNINLQVGIAVVDGKKIGLIDPQGTVNGRPMSSRLLNGFAVGISDRLNLSVLEQDGILARILQLEIGGDKMELASFLKLETKNP